MANVIRQAVQMIADAGSDRPNLRLLDVAYGPRAAELRARVASVILGIPVTKSSVHAQWGNWRKMMLNNIGGFGSCIAEQDSDFEKKARAMLDM